MKMFGIDIELGIVGILPSNVPCVGNQTLCLYIIFSAGETIRVEIKIK